MQEIERKVLLNFLKSGLSTRRLDKLLKYDHKKTKGWKSWEILKKYNLKSGDKAKLFLYSSKQSEDIIKKYTNDRGCKDFELFIRDIPSKNLERYKNTYVLAESENRFYDIFSGETRNIIQSFFKPQKDLIGKCQFRDCKNRGELDTVHFLISRPLIFKRSAKKVAIITEQSLFKYDVYKTMKLFLEAHFNMESVCFLCKKHHNELHRLEVSGKKLLRNFKRKICFC